MGKQITKSDLIFFIASIIGCALVLYDVLTDNLLGLYINPKIFFLLGLQFAKTVQILVCVVLIVNCINLYTSNYNGKRVIDLVILPIILLAGVFSWFPLSFLAFAYGFSEGEIPFPIILGYVISLVFIIFSFNKTGLLLTKNDSNKAN